MPVNVKLSDVEVGAPRHPRQYDNEAREYVEVDPCEVFLDRLHDRETTDWNTGTVSQSLFLCQVQMPRDADIYHRNYLEYLEKCWADHLGIVVTPDILWFTVLGELVSVVKESPEPYRHLFTDSDEKKTITVQTEHPEIMPLNRLVAALRDHVPTEATRFMPEFSTTSQRSRHAMLASFCDLCSPYYDYMMLLCGFPAIQVLGEQDDWDRLSASWRDLSPLFGDAGAWVDTVQETLDSCRDRREDADWWREMFKIQRCGSGHQTTVSGWLSEMYRKAPQGPRYVKNFPTSVAQVDYRELIQRRDFRMQEGLFYSHREGDFMVPDFGYTVHERTEPVVTSRGDMDVTVRSFEVRGDKRKLDADWKVEVGETRVAHQKGARFDPAAGTFRDEDDDR